MNRYGQTICLNMIVRDEAHVIRRCLASVRPLIDAWAIVDTGSSDGTPQQVREALAGVPGELFERPWRNFGHNRSEALELARGRADYVLVLDADEVLEAADQFEWPELTADSYVVEVRLHNTHYYRRQLVRDALPWRYEGVLHEYVHCPDARADGVLDGLHCRAYPEGARSRDPHKYRRDALLLENALLDEPDNARYVFYLAQCYRDAGDAEAALRNYRRRIHMGGWHEEVWYSMLQVAMLRQTLGHPWGEVMHDFLLAYQSAPTRAEPLFQIGLHYQGENAFAAAHLFFARAMALAFPGEARLFVDAEIYRCRLPLEYAVSSHYVGDYASAAATNRALLRDAPLSPHLYDLVVRNQRYSLTAQTLPMSADGNGRLALAAIPVRDPGVEFDELVESLADQAGVGWRAVFLDAGSQGDHASRIPGDDARFLWLSCKPGERWTQALASYAAEAAADSIVLLDASSRLLDPHALEWMSRMLDEPGCAVARGTSRDVDPESDREARHAADEARDDAPALATVTALACRTSLFASVQARPEEEPGTEAEFAVEDSARAVAATLLRAGGPGGVRVCAAPVTGPPRARADGLASPACAGAPAVPRISCLMVTRDRVSLGRRAIESFARQSWPNRELVIVTDGAPRFVRSLERFVEAAGLDAVTIVVPDARDYPLGTLRNLAIDRSSGDVVCQWDDDDWSHPERLQLQVDHMRRNDARACLLREHLQYFEDSHLLAWLDWSAIADHPPAHPGTLMMARDERFRYPETGPLARRGEDTHLLESLVAAGGVSILADAGHLYLYTFHGRNSFERAHHHRLSRLAVAQAKLRQQESGIRETIELARLATPVIVVGIDGPCFRVTHHDEPAIVSKAEEVRA